MIKFDTKETIRGINIQFSNNFKNIIKIKDSIKICKNALKLLDKDIVEYLKQNNFKIRIINKNELEIIQKNEDDNFKNKYDKNKAGFYFWDTKYIYYIYEFARDEKTILHEIGHYLDYIFDCIDKSRKIENLDEYKDKEDEFKKNNIGIDDKIFFSNRKYIFHRSVLDKNFRNIYYNSNKLYLKKHYNENIREFFAESFAEYIIYKNKNYLYKKFIKKRKFKDVFNYIDNFINNKNYSKSKNELIKIE